MRLSSTFLQTAKMNSALVGLLSFKSSGIYQRVFKNVRGVRCFICSVQYYSGVVQDDKILPSYISGGDSETLEIVSNSFKVFPNFLTEAEEQSLMSDVENVLRRRRYEYDHWDGAIHGYKETERVNWSEVNQGILQRVRKFVFPAQINHLPHVHVLDLADKGFIKPHIDSIKFCGDTIAGLSLLSSCVMRLVNEADKSLFVDICLHRRSLYIMTGASRYNFTHEILGQKDSYFNGCPVPRARRVSIMFRNVPVQNEA